MGHIAIKKQSYKFNLSCCFTAYCVTCTLLGTFFKNYKYFKSILKKENNFSGFIASLSQFSISTILKIANFCACFSKKSRFFIAERVGMGKNCLLEGTSKWVHSHGFLAVMATRTTEYGRLGQKATHLGW